MSSMGASLQQDMGMMGSHQLGPIPPPHMQQQGGGPIHMQQQMGFQGGGDPQQQQQQQQQQQLDPAAQQALLEQVMNLTPEQIEHLPDEHRRQVLALQQQLRQGGL
jgi:hypothetical protein